MSKVTVDVKIVLEMSVAEAEAVARVLGQELAVTSRTGEIYNQLMDVLDVVDRLPTIAGGDA